MIQGIIKESIRAQPEWMKKVTKKWKEVSTDFVARNIFFCTTLYIQLYIQYYIYNTICTIYILYIHIHTYIYVYIHTYIHIYIYIYIMVQLLNCVWLCDPMDCSTPGSSVLHYFPEFAQTHVHLVSDLILCCPFLPSIFPSIRVFYNE